MIGASDAFAVMLDECRCAARLRWPRTRSSYAARPAADDKGAREAVRGSARRYMRSAMRVRATSRYAARRAKVVRSGDSRSAATRAAPRRSFTAAIAIC